MSELPFPRPEPQIPSPGHVFLECIVPALQSELFEGVREFQAVGGDSVGDRGPRMVQSPSETPPTGGFLSSQFPDTLRLVGWLLAADYYTQS